MGGRAAGCVGTGEQQQGMASSRASLHARPRVGGPKGARGRQPPGVGLVKEAGVLEHCRFLLIHFGSWQAQLIAEGGALFWLFGRMSASV